MGRKWTVGDTSYEEVGYSHPMMKALRASNATFLKGGLEIAAEAATIWSILQDMNAPLAPKSRPLPRVESRSPSKGRIATTSQGTSLQTFDRYRAAGRAYLSQNFIRLYGRVDWHTLAHELVHMALPYGVGHSRPFYEALREVIERRWSVRLSVSTAPARYGYAWDWHFRKQYLHLTEKRAIPTLQDTLTTLKVAAERKPRTTSGKPRSSAKQVEAWLDANVGAKVRIATVMAATGAAVNTVRKHVGTRLTPIEWERGTYRVQPKEVAR